MNQQTHPRNYQQPSGYSQQNYPQQRNYQPQANYQQSQYYIPPRKKHTFISIGLVLIILFGAVGLYFAIKPKLTNVLNDNTALNAAPAPDLQSASAIPRVEITTLKLCNNVDENFVCDENTQRIFKRGDMFYVYAEVSVTIPKIYNTSSISMNDGIKIVTEYGDIIYDNSAFSYIQKNFESGKINKFKINHEFASKQTDPARKEIIQYTITDTNSKQKTTKNVEYEMI